MLIKHTIVQTIPVKRQADSGLVDDTLTHIMHSPSSDPYDALNETIESLAEMELDDDIPSEDRAFEIEIASDRVPGRFDVYAGHHHDVPTDLQPVLTDGDI